MPSRFPPKVELIVLDGAKGFLSSERDCLLFCLNGFEVMKVFLLRCRRNLWSLPGAAGVPAFSLTRVSFVVVRTLCKSSDQPASLLCRIEPFFVIPFWGREAGGEESPRKSKHLIGLAY